MPSDPFVHLHVASGYSLRHGVSHPPALVERAVDHGMDTLALTDRDGVYGAVKFVTACRAAGVRPVLGVDLAVAPSGLLPARRSRAARRTPARGGVSVDPRHPRITLLAQNRAGWARLCRLISATHLSGERGVPVTTLDLVAEAAQYGGVFVLLGPDSEVGRALAGRRPDLARAVVSRWREVVSTADLCIEVVSHRGPEDRALSSVHAARLLGLAHDERLGAVLTNAVRHADRIDAPVCDVLDASRRLVALDARHVDRINAEGHLKSGKQMREVADEVATFSGLGSRAAAELLAATRAVADRCALDPRADLGVGDVHFPELRNTSQLSDADADQVLRERCEAGLGRRGMALTVEVLDRLRSELRIIAHLGYASYFLTVADVTQLIREMGIRCAARGSGAGSLVNYLLEISGVDPMQHGLLMERFLSPLRQALPDIDIDVESARRTEVYEKILERYGGERCTCVSMMDTYRVRHAIRDVGSALGLPPAEIDALAKAFPHIRARDVRAALRELPELRAARISEAQLGLLFWLVERLDGLPRHLALHPCGVLLSDATLLDRTPVEASWLGFPMSQFDKDDVEVLGLLKLDVLGIRMQSAMAHAVAEIRRIEDAEGAADATGPASAGAAGPAESADFPADRPFGRTGPDIDGINIDSDIDSDIGIDIDVDRVPLDDPATFRLIRSTRTLGCFQIESPGQRELIGKFGPETFADLIVDISLFRPGPVKSDMVTPFLEARQGWTPPRYLHDDLRDALADTCGVVVFHEQVLQIVHTLTGCTLAEADEVRRALGDAEGQEEARVWFYPRAAARGYDRATIDRVWEVLRAFGSFGFCKAHAAAFALPTYQSAWLKAHHPAAFLAGVLTHDPGMYPKRLILDDARQFGITVLPLDVNRSDAVYRVEKVDEDWIGPPPEEGLPDGRGYGIRLSLADVKGISDAEVARIVACRPFSSLSDFWHRTGVSRPVVERLVEAGAFDSLYGTGVLRSGSPAPRRDGVTRRDLLLQVLELDRWTRTARIAGRRRRVPDNRIAVPDDRIAVPDDRITVPGAFAFDVRAHAARQSQAPLSVERDLPVQLTFDFVPGGAVVDAVTGSVPAGSVLAGFLPGDTVPASGLPEMTGSERVRAELEILGLDATRHVIDFYVEFLDELRVTRSRELLHHRSGAELLVAGVKVATQTPPVRSGRRVIFVTLDDATGPVDATFFEDAQGPYAATVFHSWLLVIRGVLRRTGRRGVSLRATGCWELPVLYEAWENGGLQAVAELMTPALPASSPTEQAVQGAAESRSTRPVMVRPPAGWSAGPSIGSGAGGMRRRRVLVHPSGSRQSPYADVRPAGDSARSAPRKLWHSSGGSSGR